MTENLLEWDGFSSFLLLIGWLIAGHRVGLLLYSPTLYILKRRTASLIVLVVLIALFVAAKTVSVAILWSAGEQAMQTKWLLDLAMLIVPGMAVLAMSLPRLQRMARSPMERPDAPCEASDRQAAAEPQLAVPVQVAAAGAAAMFYWTWFTATPPGPTEVLVPLALTAGLLPVLWIRQFRRFRLAGLSGWSKPGPGIRALKAAVFVAIVAAMAAVWLSEARVVISP